MHINVLDLNKILFEFLKQGVRSESQDSCKNYIISIIYYMYNWLFFNNQLQIKIMWLGLKKDFIKND